MTPLFLDGARDQLVVNLLNGAWGRAPYKMLWRATLDDRVSLARRGQDDAAALLRCGLRERQCWHEALSLCPKGKATELGVCSPF